MSLKTKDLISIDDLSREAVDEIFALTTRLKDGSEQGPLLPGKTLGLLFSKSSTRTRVSFETGMLQLGGHSIFLSAHELQIGRGESIPDTARILSSYLDGIVIRTAAHEEVITFAQHAEIAVINGLTDLLHPCQVLTDIYTIHEIKKQTEGIKVAYIGDGSNNLAHSWLFGASRLGLNLSIATPVEFRPRNDIFEKAKRESDKKGCFCEVITLPQEAVKEADVVYTDVWVSMGQEEKREQRITAMKPYQVNAALLAHAKKDAIVMHCLPAHREEEITSEVMDGPQSVVFQQAANRLHVQKAILVLLLT